MDGLCLVLLSVPQGPGLLSVHLPSWSRLSGHFHPLNGAAQPRAVALSIFPPAAGNPPSVLSQPSISLA